MHRNHGCDISFFPFSDESPDFLLKSNHCASFSFAGFYLDRRPETSALIIARMMPGHPMKAACNDVSKVRWTTLRASCLKTKRFRNYLYTTVSLFNQLNEKYRKSLPAAHSVILYLAWLCVSKLAGRSGRIIFLILNTYRVNSRMCILTLICAIQPFSYSYSRCCFRPLILIL